MSNVLQVLVTTLSRSDYPLGAVSELRCQLHLDESIYPYLDRILLLRFQQLYSRIYY